MSHLEIWLPSIILILAFALKLVVDRKAELPDFFIALLEFPVDVAFLAITLIAAYAIATGDHAGEAIFLFAVYIVGSLFIVFLWRRSHGLFIENRHFSSFCTGTVEYVVSATGLVYAIDLLTEAVQ